MFTFICASYGQTTLPVIKIDDAHWAAQREGGSEALKYQVPKGEGFVLDVSGYKFKIPVSLGIQEPNFIMISVEKNQQYGIVWDSSRGGQYVISRETLRPLSDSLPFHGFKKGQEIVIAIGYLNTVSNASFYPFWYSFVEII